LGPRRERQFQAGGRIDDDRPDSTIHPHCGCRYGVFDCEYTDPKTGSNRNKIVFFAWVPDNAKVRPKMIFASSKDELKKRLVGVACEVQAADAGDLEYPSVVEKILRV